MKMRPRFCEACEDGIERGGVFGGFAGVVEFAVAVVDGDFVPDADVGGVALREIGDAVFIEGDPGVRVVHDGDGLFGGVGEAGGGEVVGEAEGVAGLVRGELAGALENHR